MSPRFTSRTSGDHLLEHRDPACAEALEEGRLGLDRGHLGGEDLGGLQGEFLQPVHRVGEPPGVQQRGVRVDPGAQRPTAVHRGPESRAEGLDHRIS
jgi:hypothetical protein